MQITGMRFQHDGSVLCRAEVDGKPRFFLGREEKIKGLRPSAHTVAGSVNWMQHRYRWKRLAGGLVGAESDEMSELANRMARRSERRWMFMEGRIWQKKTG